LNDHRASGDAIGGGDLFKIRSASGNKRRRRDLGKRGIFKNLSRGKK
jgi:hypothetical protein